MLTKRKPEITDKWDNRFMEMAALVSTWSKDPSTKVGAVIVDPYRFVVSVGFNGFPSGVDDSEEALAHRPTKLACTIHAEENAILSAKRDLTGCTLYVNPLPPCATCAAKIIQAGIMRVVCTGNIPERWAESVDISLKIFRQADVTVDKCVQTPAF